MVRVFYWDFPRAGKTESALMETGPHKESVSESSARAGQGDSANSEQSAAQRGVTQLIEYVRVLIELSDKPVWSLASYGNVILHEEDLRNRVGIRHDLPDVDGPIYVKIDRLRRTDPPPPPPAARIG